MARKGTVSNRIWLRDVVCADLCHSTGFSLYALDETIDSQSYHDESVT